MMPKISAMVPALNKNQRPCPRELQMAKTQAATLGSGGVAGVGELPF